MKVLSIFASIFAFSSTQVTAQATGPEFCWKDTYGRGVGTIPNQCPPGKERIGLLCYSHCPNGMYRFGFDCHPNCPSGFRDEGLFCRKDAYGRGAGYAFWDWNLCQSHHGNGNCEWHGALIYPKCAPGYHNSGCCICTPNNIDCNSLPWMSEVPDGASCAKQIRIGDPTPMGCASSKVNSGGLCYDDSCAPGYTGVGPVCWGDAPHGMEDCGMGAAEDSGKCAEVITSQVVSVFELARKCFANCFLLQHAFAYSHRWPLNSVILYVQYLLPAPGPVELPRQEHRLDGLRTSLH